MHLSTTTSHGPSSPGRPVNLDALGRHGYGIGCHWTTWTLNADGTQLPFERAVDEFDVRAFANRVAETDAGHVLFTINHALHWLACPSHETDRVMPGRTCRRDLIRDLIDALRAHGIALMLYYHHGCDLPEQDPAWQRAVGGYDDTPVRLYDHVIRILTELGERYGSDVVGWWFDAGWALQKRGQTPWPALFAAAKAGHPSRLVSFNPGIHSTDPLSDLQDYWPGEVEGIEFVPDATTAPGGLAWYSFRTFHRGGETAWGINALSLHTPRVLPSVDVVVDIIRAYRRVGGAITFNLLVYQNGEFYEPERVLMQQVQRRLTTTP